MGSVGWTAGGDLFGRTAMLAVTLLIARALSPSQFGLFLAMLAAAVLAAVAFDAGVTQAAARDVAVGSLELRSSMRAALRARRKTLVPWLVVFALVVVLAAVRVNVWTIAAFLVYSAAVGTSGLLVGLGRGGRRFREAAVSVGAGRLTAVSASVLFLLADWHLTVARAGALLTLGEVVTIAVALRAVGFGLRTRVPAFSLWRALPYCANSSLATAYNRCDVILVSGLAGAVSLANYSPASRLQDGLFALPGAVGLVAVPFLARIRADSVRRRTALKMSIVGAAAAIPMAFIASVFAEPIASTIFGAAYSDSASPLRILVWFLPFSMFQAPLLAAMIAGGRAVDTTKVFAITFATALVAHLILDPRWGATGAAVASLSRDAVAAPFAAILAFKPRKTSGEASPAVAHALSV